MGELNTPRGFSPWVVNISTGKKVEEFVEEAENFGRIKAIYDSIRNQLNENYRMQIESDKRKSEEREKIEKEKALKKLERIL